MPIKTADLDPLIQNLETAFRQAHSAQLAALEALRIMAKQAEHQPGGSSWDWELDGNGLEGIPTEIGVLTVKEVGKFLRLSNHTVGLGEK